MKAMAYITVFSEQDGIYQLYAENMQIRLIFTILNLNMLSQFNEN
jgi:hypothetical protein